MTDTSEPVELALCEQKRLVLKPDVLYVFRVQPGCVECERIAREADEEAWGC